MTAPKYPTEWARNVARIERVLLAQGITTREQLDALVDKGKTESIKGIGPVLAPILEKALKDFDPLRWQQWFKHIAWDDYVAEPVALAGEE